MVTLDRITLASPRPRGHGVYSPARGLNGPTGAGQEATEGAGGGGGPDEDGDGGGQPGLVEEVVAATERVGEGRGKGVGVGGGEGGAQYIRVEVLGTVEGGVGPD